MRISVRRFICCLAALLIGVAVLPVCAQQQRHRPRRPISNLLDDIKQNSGSLESKKALAELHEAIPDKPGDVALLAEVADSQDEKVRRAAIKSLQNVEPGSVNLRPAYTDLLQHKAPKIRMAAMKGCGILKAKDAAPRIRRLLSESPKHKFSKEVGKGRKYSLGGADADSIEYVQTAAEALVELDDVESLDEILSRDEVMGIGGFGGPLVARFGARALPKALVAARQKDSSRSDGARGVISSMRDEKAVPELIPLLKDKDMAPAAALSLSAMPLVDPKNKAAVESALQSELKNPDRHIRGYAFEGLLRINPSKYSDQAIKAVREDSDARLSILYGLIRNPVPEAAPGLEKFISEDEGANPHLTDNRRLAAQAIFVATGKRVPYKGVERDRRRSSDPYNPKATR